MPHVPYSTQAVIGYDNVFARGTLTASSESTDGPAENAVDGLTFDFWQPDGETAGDTLQVFLGAAASVDYLAIAAHTLGTEAASITLQGSANGSSWTTVAGPFEPEEDKPYLWRFAAQSFAYWRVLILGGSVQLGVLQAGVALVLPEGVFVGHKPAPLNRRPKLSPNESETGQFLGRSVIRQGAGAEIRQDRVAQSWVRETWQPFAEHAETGAFFFAWRQELQPEEVIYGWSDDGAKVEQGANGFMSVALDISGQVE